MHFYTYKITNLLNGKIYIGVHKTENLEDNYMGSGKILKRSIVKHGIENFKKDILMYHDSESDMFEVEALIVDQDFVDRKDTYNLKLGGHGGWDHLNKDPGEMSRRMGLCQLEIKRKRDNVPGYDEDFRKQRSTRITNKWNDPEYRLKVSNSLKNTFAISGAPWTGKTHSDDTKLKMSKSAKGKHAKERNSQFGKMWIYSLELKQSKRINKNDLIPEGWNKGRKMFKD